MKCDSLWMSIEGGKTATVRVRLAKCRNCGKTKILSRPCGFDHLAAILEFNAAREQGRTPTAPTRSAGP